jgi:hypothetical protein
LKCEEQLITQYYKKVLYTIFSARKERTKEEELSAKEDTTKKRLWMKRLCCEFCKESFSERTELRNHLNIHRTFKCNSCDAAFLSYKPLKKHKNKNHPAEKAKQNEGKELPKKKDSKFLNKEEELSIKERNEEEDDTIDSPHSTESKRFCCTICKQSFSMRTELGDHLQTHKALKCNTCTKTFLSYKSLKKHEKQHKKENKFSCNTCNKIYSSCISLNKHKMLHTNSENLYACDLCGKEFGVKVSRDLHKRSHECKGPNSKEDAMNVDREHEIRVNEAIMEDIKDEEAIQGEIQDNKSTMQQKIDGELIKEGIRD